MRPGARRELPVRDARLAVRARELDAPRARGLRLQQVVERDQHVRLDRGRLGRERRRLERRDGRRARLGGRRGGDEQSGDEGEGSERRHGGGVSRSRAQVAKHALAPARCRRPAALLPQPACVPASPGTYDGRTRSLTMLDGLRLIEPRAYSELGYPHAEWKALRKEPLTYFEPAGWQPFWA